MARQLLFLEFNEINFEDVAFYCRNGQLPNLKALIESNGWARTTSEQRYEDLEPWIQWVTAHTGKPFAEHGVFRLGDIVNHDIPQIWERLENAGVRVGAVCPMNAKNRLRDPAFFVPDPWTPTKLAAPPRLAQLHEAIVQAVNDNAQSRVTMKSVRQLLAGFLAYSRIPNYLTYAWLIASGKPWRRAIVLDLLLADVFVKEVRRNMPRFATLFLNAGAHIQHHYLFSARSYRGEHRNPAWYVAAGADPVREVYEIYDRILGMIRKAFPDARLMIATGLHQEPHGTVTFYWRLRDHAAFLKRIEVPFTRAEPRMSRDFLVTCESPEQARQAQARLSAAVAADGRELFSVDNRGSDLFVMLTYPGEINSGTRFSIGERQYSALDRDVAFVALKNGEHNGIGYFLDSETRFRGADSTIELMSIPDRIFDAFGLHMPATG